MGNDVILQNDESCHREVIGCAKFESVTLPVGMQVSNGVDQVTAIGGLNDCFTNIHALWLVKIFHLAVTFDVVLYCTPRISIHGDVQRHVSQWDNAVIKCNVRPCVLDTKQKIVSDM
jgi:hypothetical protein